MEKFRKPSRKGQDQNVSRDKADCSTISRKNRRKEKRHLVKLRRQAYSQGKQVPTLASINKEKEHEITRAKEKETAEKRKRQKNAQKKRAKLKRQEQKVTERQAFVDGLNDDEKEIKKYEKLLRLNKRKSKTIAQGFKNDGLDFVLEAVDPELLKTMVTRGEDDQENHLDALDLLAEGESSGSDEETIEREDEHNESDDEDNDMDAEEQELDDGEQQMDDTENEIDDTEQDIDDPELEIDGEDGEIDVEENEFHDENLESSGDSDEAKDFDDEIIDHSDESDEEYSASVTEAIKHTKHRDKTNTTLKSKCGEASISEGEPPTKRTKHDKVQQPTKQTKHDKDDLQDITEETQLMQKATKPSKKKKKSKKNDVGNIGSADCNASDNKDYDNTDDNTVVEESQYKEDIYGRLRDEDGNIVTSQSAYVPPGKRLAMAANLDEKKQLQLERLTRQLKGQFNRLSESNVQSIANYIEEMFRSHSRAELTECLSALLMESLVSSYPLPERLIMEHCMLVAILHARVGMEIGATLVQSLAIRFDQLLQQGSDYGAGKEMDNLVVVFANLYNFKVLHSLLIFDIMKTFAGNFNEKDVDLLLIMFRNVGFSLRKDDPLALKEFIVHVQDKASGTENTSSRMKFMLEVILHIKNNNMRKIPNYDPTHLDHLKKLLRNCTGSSLGEAELRISLVDLLTAQERGKWWLVGSAWGGRHTDEDTKESAKPLPVPNVSNKILELARKQRMNTDVRRTIFCVIMTCEDCVDAFEKLLQLGLKQQQEREIIHVIIDLCLQEKQFNPFYAYLAQKFCEYDRRFERTVQFNLWDKFKELQSMAEIQSSNLALFLTQLVVNKALSLSIFKVIEFSDLDKSRVSFMKVVLSSLLLRHDDVTVEEIFLRITGMKKLHMLCEGLKLFLRHFMLKSRMKSISKQDHEILKTRVCLAEKALNSRNSKIQM